MINSMVDNFDLSYNIKEI